MKNFRVGNIIEANGHLTVIYECSNDLIWFYDNKGNVDFLKIYDERIKDVELSNFLLDKMFKEKLKKGFDNFYNVWIVNKDLHIEIREATRGFNILCYGFEMFKIFSVRELQNVYAMLWESPIIGCRKLSDNEKLSKNKSPRELDENLRNIFNIGWYGL